MRIILFFLLAFTSLAVNAQEICKGNGDPNTLGLVPDIDDCELYKDLTNQNVWRWDGTSIWVLTVNGADNGTQFQNDGDISLGYEIGQAKGDSPLDYETGIDLNASSLSIIGDAGESNQVVRFLPNNNIRLGSYERIGSQDLLEFDYNSSSFFMGRVVNAPELNNHFIGSYNFGIGNRATSKGGTFNFTMGTRSYAESDSDYNLINTNIGNVYGDYNIVTGTSTRNLGDRNIITGLSFNNTVNTTPNNQNILTGRISTLDGSDNNVASITQSLCSNMDRNIGVFAMHNYSDGGIARGIYEDVFDSFVNITTSSIDTVRNVSRSLINGRRMNIHSADNSIIMGGNIKNDADNVAIFMPFGSNITGNLSTHDYKFTNTTPDKWFSAYENGYELYTSYSLSTNGLASFPTGVTLASGASSWASISARKFKEGGNVVDYEKIYDSFKDVEVFEGWNYIGQNDKHIGVMADDFYKLVNEEIGNQHNDEKIETIDADGVQMALIKAMQAKIEQLESRIKEIEND